MDPPIAGHTHRRSRGAGCRGESAQMRLKNPTNRHRARHTTVRSLRRLRNRTKKRCATGVQRIAVRQKPQVNRRPCIMSIAQSAVFLSISRPALLHSKQINTRPHSKRPQGKSVKTMTSKHSNGSLIVSCMVLRKWPKPMGKRCKTDISVVMHGICRTTMRVRSDADDMVPIQRRLDDR